MTKRTRTVPTRSIARGIVGLAALAAFSVGVPMVLWWGTGGRFLPEPGPGGWTEIRAQLAAGQLPDPAVVAAAAVAGWVLWAYLMAMLAAETIAAWRERGQSTARARQLSGPRRLIARLVGWVFAGHTMVASVLVTPHPDLAHLAPVAAVADHDATTAALAPIEASPGERAGGFDPHAYVDFDPTTNQTAPAATAGTERPVAVEREIVRGDTLWAIAEELTGDGMNWPAIWAATDLDAQNPPVDPHNPDLIFPGNLVRIPAHLIPEPVLDQLLQPAPASEQTGPAASPNPVTADHEQPSAEHASPPAVSNATPDPAAAPDPPAAAAQRSASGNVIPTAGADGAPLAAVAALAGLGAAASAVILAGMRRRRSLAMATSTRGQRPPKRTKRDTRASQRLAANLPATMWEPEHLAASWNSLRPLDAGARQPWCVRWNSALRVLECAWTPDPANPSGTPSDPPHPDPASPWRLVDKQDRAGRSVAVWTITEDHIPGAPDHTVVPAMVGCADGRGDRPSSDGFFINLEAAGIITIESSKPELIEPEGVIRALLLQLQASTVADVHLLNTNLDLPGLDHDTIHTDPIAFESELVADLTRHQDLWDQVPSVFVARTERTYTGPVTVVVGTSHDLQSCSHLLSLARAENIPLVVIAIGPLAHAWASFHLEPEPDKHTIRFPAARAVLTFDHLSWVSATEAADLVDLITASARPWTHDPGPRPDLIDMPPGPTLPDGSEPDTDNPHHPEAEPEPDRRGFGEPTHGHDLFSGWDVNLSAGDDSDRTGEPPSEADGDASDLAGVDVRQPSTIPGRPADTHLNGNRARPATSQPTSALTIDILDADPDWPPEPFDGDYDHSDIAEPETIDDLWSHLPEADPTTLADQPPLHLDDIDWALVGDDTTIDELIDATLDDLLHTTHRTTPGQAQPPDSYGHSVDPEDDTDPGDDDAELIVVSPWLTNEAAGTGPHPTKSNDTPPTSGANRRQPATGRVGPRTQAAVLFPELDDHRATSDETDHDDERPVESPLVGPATTAGLRLELCGPIRLLRTDPDSTELHEVPIGKAGLTAAQLALLAYLVIAARPNGGVGREQIAAEFWPDAHGDGTSRTVQPGTVKRRIVELRGRLATVAADYDGKALIPEAVDGCYRLSLANDWHELKVALVNAEASTQGSAAWTEAITTITRIVRPPGLLTPPTGARHSRHYAWIDEHYHSLVQDASRRVLVILADHAQHHRAHGRHDRALDILMAARAISPMYPREIADGVVATYLALGDPVRAEHECSLYERQFDEGFAIRERSNPQTGNPRVRLNGYLNHKDSTAT